MYEVTFKDIAIIDSLPVYDCPKTILNIGCGVGDLDTYLCHMGYRVYATDLCKHEEWEAQDKKEWVDKNKLTFHSDVSILSMDTIPIKKAAIVVCSQVLEHIPNYKVAFKNMLDLCDIRLIVTFPFRKSYNVTPKDIPRVGGTPHCNFWSDKKEDGYKDVNEFVELAKPYPVSISKNIAKDSDWSGEQRYYLVVVDKRHKDVRR